MDKRTKKTQKAILNAYMALLSEKENIEKITVSDIADRADISRSTFYAYYTDVFALRDDISEILAEEICNIVVTAHNTSGFSGYEGYQALYTSILDYLKEKKSAVRVVFTHSSYNVLIESICSMIQNILFQFYKSEYSRIDPEVLRCTAIFWTNGCSALIKEWVLHDFDIPTYKMAGLISGAIQSCGEFFLTTK